MVNSIRDKRHSDQFLDRFIWSICLYKGSRFCVLLFDGIHLILCHLDDTLGNPVTCLCHLQSVADAKGQSHDCTLQMHFCKTWIALGVDSFPPWNCPWGGWKLSKKPIYWGALFFGIKTMWSYAGCRVHRRCKSGAIQSEQNREIHQRARRWHFEAASARLCQWEGSQAIKNHAGRPEVQNGRLSSVCRAQKILKS